MEFINDYLVAIILVICLCVGYIIKKIEFIPNKYIPLIMGVLGVILSLVNALTNNLPIDLIVIAQGLVSGLASTGMHQAFTQIIEKGEANGDTD